MISYIIRPYRILTATDRHNIRCELKELINGRGLSRIAALENLHRYGICIDLEGNLIETAKAILAVEFKA
jgi:hypothetical protein